jgi:hypothetical protein
MVNLLGRIVRVVAEILRDLDAVKHVPSALNNDRLQIPARRRSSEKRTTVLGQAEGLLFSSPPMPLHRR